MEDVKFTAVSRYFKKKNFKGVLEFSVVNNVLTIKMGDGRTFTSPLETLKVRHHSFLLTYMQNLKQYSLTAMNGTTLLIKRRNWAGYSQADLTAMSDILESVPDCKRTVLDFIELVISFIALGVLIWSFF